MKLQVVHGEILFRSVTTLSSPIIKTWKQYSQYHGLPITEDMITDSNSAELREIDIKYPCYL